MTVYVCFLDGSYDGCSPPQRAFSTEIQAQEWCKVNRRGDYEELEVEEEAVKRGIES